MSDPPLTAFEATKIIVTLIGLEALLSADNALVLAVLVRHLPKELRSKALLYGLGGAFVFRLIAILTAAYIIKFWYLQAAGAAYLLYLPAKHFWGHGKAAVVKAPGGVRRSGFWPTVLAVELMDIAFAIDSVLVAVALTNRLWIIYAGAMLGVVFLRFAAGGLVRLLDRIPDLEHVAYIVVAWVAVKLGFLAVHSFDKAYQLGWGAEEIDKTVFWVVLGAIVTAGTLWAVLRKRGQLEAGEAGPATPKDAGEPLNPRDGVEPAPAEDPEPLETESKP